MCMFVFSVAAFAGCTENGTNNPDSSESPAGMSSNASTSNNRTQLTFEQAIKSENIDGISIKKIYAARVENYETADAEKVDQFQQWFGKAKLSETDDTLNVYGSTVYNINLEVDGVSVINLYIYDLGTWYLRDCSNETQPKDYLIENYSELKDEFLQLMEKMTATE